MENQRIIELDETQVRELYPVPVMHIGCWTFTMETWLLEGELAKAVSAVFVTFPEVVQHALTFVPESGGGVGRPGQVVAGCPKAGIAAPAVPRRYAEDFGPLCTSSAQAAGKTTPIQFAQ